MAAATERTLDCSSRPLVVVVVVVVVESADDERPEVAADADVDESGEVDACDEEIEYADDDAAAKACVGSEMPMARTTAHMMERNLFKPLFLLKTAINTQSIPSRYKP